MHRKKIHIIQTVLLVAVLASFAATAFGLLAGSVKCLATLGEFGLSAFQNAFGIIALIVGASLAWRPTRMIGTLIASACLGGVIALFIAYGKNPLIPAVILIMVWLVHKMNWWKFWHHGYRCGCKICTMHRGESPQEKTWCDCRAGCVCESGACRCDDTL